MHPHHDRKPDGDRNARPARGSVLTTMRRRPHPLHRRRPRPVVGIVTLAALALGTGACGDATEAAPVASVTRFELPAESVEPADENAWMTIADDSGLTPEQIAAVSVAVAVHADVRRKQGAPANRVYAPGSRLWASRWVAMGRSSQMTNQRR